MASFPLLSSIEATLRRWSASLAGGLTFSDNFIGFEWEGQINAGEEIKITHDLELVPTRFLVTYSDGVNTLVRGPSKRATGKFFYIKNIATSGMFSGKILILP